MRHQLKQNSSQLKYHTIPDYFYRHLRATAVINMFFNFFI